MGSRARLRRASRTVVAWRLAYSHQHAEWNGGVTGGLITDESCDDPTCFLDHDQRDTLSTGVNLTLPVAMPGPTST